MTTKLTNEDTSGRYLLSRTPSPTPSSPRADRSPSLSDPLLSKNQSESGSAGSAGLDEVVLQEPVMGTTPMDKPEFQYLTGRLFYKATTQARIVRVLSGAFIITAFLDVIRRPLFALGIVNGKSWSLIDKASALGQKVKAVYKDFKEEGDKQIDQKSKNKISALVKKLADSHIEHDKTENDYGVANPKSEKILNELVETSVAFLAREREEEKLSERIQDKRQTKLQRFLDKHIGLVAKEKELTDMTPLGSLMYSQIWPAIMQRIEEFSQREESPVVVSPKDEAKPVSPRPSKAQTASKAPVADSQPQANSASSAPVQAKQENEDQVGCLGGLFAKSGSPEPKPPTLSETVAAGVSQYFREGPEDMQNLRALLGKRAAQLLLAEEQTSGKVKGNWEMERTIVAVAKELTKPGDNQILNKNQIQDFQEAALDAVRAFRAAVQKELSQKAFDELFQSVSALDLVGKPLSDVFEAYEGLKKAQKQLKAGIARTGEELVKAAKKISGSNEYEGPSAASLEERVIALKAELADNQNRLSEVRSAVYKQYPVVFAQIEKAQKLWEMDKGVLIGDDLTRAVEAMREVEKSAKRSAELYNEIVPLTLAEYVWGRQVPRVVKEPAVQSQVLPVVEEPAEQVVVKEPAVQSQVLPVVEEPAEQVVVKEPAVTTALPRAALPRDDEETPFLGKLSRL